MIARIITVFLKNLALSITATPVLRGVGVGEHQLLDTEMGCSLDLVKQEQLGLHHTALTLHAPYFLHRSCIALYQPTRFGIGRQCGCSINLL